MSLPEILVRGTFVYISVVLLLRIILKRQAGKVGLSDLLVVTIIAGVCRNPLVRDSYLITDGLLVIATVLFWSYALDWLCYYSPFIHKLFHPKPVPLIRDGVVLSDNLSHELITKSQLQCKLRREGKRPRLGGGELAGRRRPRERGPASAADKRGGSDKRR